MNISQLYFNLGIQHILDVVAFDHILFLLVLSAPYSIKNYKQVIGLATVFTLGHSSTLVFATLGWFNFSIEWIEFLIPCTIFIAALVNLVGSKGSKNVNHVLTYSLTLFFGLIHGMGFSNYLMSLLVSEVDLIKPLLFFNLGIEAGQLMVLAMLLLINYIICRQQFKRQIHWTYILSAIAALAAVVLMVVRFP